MSAGSRDPHHPFWFVFRDWKEAVLTSRLSGGEMSERFRIPRLLSCPNGESQSIANRTIAVPYQKHFFRKSVRARVGHDTKENPPGRCCEHYHLKTLKGGTCIQESRNGVDHLSSNRSIRTGSKIELSNLRALPAILPGLWPNLHHRNMMGL